MLISENKQSINISSLFQLSFILWFKNYETELYICTIFSMSLWRKFNFEISVIQTLQKCIFSDSFMFFSKNHLQLFLEYWKHLIKIQIVEIKIKNRGLNTCLLHSATTTLISFIWITWYWLQQSNNQISVNAIRLSIHFFAILRKQENRPKFIDWTRGLYIWPTRIRIWDFLSNQMIIKW